MNELKEQIDDILPMEWWVCEDDTYTIVKYDREEMIDDLMQLIETYTNKAINNARSKDPMKCEFGHEVYAHSTADGWCCACEADIAFLNAEIKRKELEARRDEMNKLLPMFTNRILNLKDNAGYVKIKNRITQLSTQLTNKKKGE